MLCVCSARGGQHADHHHRLGSRGRHRAAHGLHAAQELHHLRPRQDGGEKVSGPGMSPDQDKIELMRFSGSGWRREVLVLVV